MRTSPRRSLAWSKATKTIAPLTMLLESQYRCTMINCGRSQNLPHKVNSTQTWTAPAVRATRARFIQAPTPCQSCCRRSALMLGLAPDLVAMTVADVPVTLNVPSRQATITVITKVNAAKVLLLGKPSTEPIHHGLHQIDGRDLARAEEVGVRRRKSGRAQRALTQTLCRPRSSARFVMRLNRRFGARKATRTRRTRRFERRSQKPCSVVSPLSSGGPGFAKRLTTAWLLARARPPRSERPVRQATIPVRKAAIRDHVAARHVAHVRHLCALRASRVTQCTVAPQAVRARAVWLIRCRPTAAATDPRQPPPGIWQTMLFGSLGVRGSKVIVGSRQMRTSAQQSLRAHFHRASLTTSFRLIGTQAESPVQSFTTIARRFAAIKAY
mmetsp:Transcript_2507/g.7662  ORF Transcript_2507/g.7662 Transcript_2507/m.7662 type:complete len:384 (-) Transcript_2507:386-1537(-)